MISEELLQSFIAEASDLLDDAEPSLVEYPRREDIEERTEIVNRVFRHFHSIKGSAGFVGLHDIARLTHEAETLLEQYRKTPERLIPEKDINLLCRTVDLLRAIFANGGESFDADGKDLGLEALIKEIVEATKTAKGSTHSGGTLADNINILNNPELEETQIVDPQSMEAALASVDEAIHDGSADETDPSGVNYAAARPSRRHDTEKFIKREKPSADETQPVARIDLSDPVPTPEPRPTPPSPESTDILEIKAKEPQPATPGKTTTVRGTSSMTRSRRPSSDTARIIKGSQMAKQDKLNTGDFAARYVAEANELLEQIEQSLLHAEQHPESGAESIQEALRCLHSFKGNSGFMNLADLERLSHRMESEVEAHSKRTLGLDTNTFDALLQMIDVLRQGVHDFAIGGSGEIPEADAYIEMIDEFSSEGAGTRYRRPSTTILHGLGAKSGEVAKQAGETGGQQPDAAPPATEANTTVAAAKGTPGTERRDPKVNENETRRIGKPMRTASETTRMVLRGNTSMQENLADFPKAQNIIISADPVPSETSSRTPVEAGRSGDTTRAKRRAVEADTAKIENMTKSVDKPVGTDTASIVRGRKISETDKKTAGGKTSDTSQKRRSDALASRNDIRVDLRKLDSMLDLVGELVIAEAMVTRHPVVWNADNESLERAVHQLRRVASSLQDMATSVRMIPLAPTFRRMTRLVYDLSVKAGKQVDLILLGEDTEVDRTVIERISDPMVHIIRNAIDHGIEPPDVRRAQGKPETGRLTIEGHHEGGEVWIVITDDGRGLDRSAILNRAISRGLIQGDGSDLSDREIYHFIFEPGFSTAERVTDISGRGFGMDVVKKNIEKLSGRIDIQTRPGEGTAVVMRIPLTLAIIDGMLVSSGDNRYIIPLLSIRESLRPEADQIVTTPDGQELLKLRGELIPIVKLQETFIRESNARTLFDGILMIVEGEDGDVIALFADELIGQQETVIKGLSGWLKKSRGVSGCTILGDGEVGLILDIGAIVRMTREKTPGLKNITLS